MLEDDINPYQAPATSGHLATPPPLSANERPFRLLRRYRQQMHGLGGLWVVNGVVGTALVLTLAVERWPWMPFKVGLAACGIVSGAIWLALAVLTFLKRMWAVQIGIGLCGLSLVALLVATLVAA